MNARITRELARGANQTRQYTALADLIQDQCMELTRLPWANLSHRDPRRHSVLTHQNPEDLAEISSALQDILDRVNHEGEYAPDNIAVLPLSTRR